jgi:hypothetical protein
MCTEYRTDVACLTETPKEMRARKKAGLRIRIHFIRIRILIQHFRLNTDPDPKPIRIQGFNDQKF